MALPTEEEVRRTITAWQAAFPGVQRWFDSFHLELRLATRTHLTGLALRAAVPECLDRPSAVYQPLDEPAIRRYYWEKARAEREMVRGWGL